MRFTGLAQPVRLKFDLNLASFQVSEDRTCTSLADEARTYLLINTSGTAQTTADLDNARSVAERAAGQLTAHGRADEPGAAPPTSHRRRVLSAPRTNIHDMTTPAPDAPFDPHAFPGDLLAKQCEAAELYAALHAHRKTLPWSREPHKGWPAESERGREHRGRPASPGWTNKEAAEHDGLFEALRKATAAVNAHDWWETCDRHGIKGDALVAARMALKPADGAVPALPLRQGDVDATA